MSLAILKEIFNPNDIARSFETFEPLKSTIIDTLFKNKENHSSPYLSYSTMKNLLRSVPVVRRDGSPVSLDNNEFTLDLFAPLPIKVSTNIRASELNDLKALMGNKAAIDAWRSKKIDELRQATRITTEGMASTVATTGKISWQLEVKGGQQEVYEIDFGKIPTLDGQTQFTNTSKIADIYNILKAMETKINMNGYGGKITFFTGKEVFTVLMNVLENITSYSQQNIIRVNLNANTLYVGGYEIISLDETYPDPTNTWVAKLNAKSLLAVASDIEGCVYYCALDSISANNQAMPMHIFPKINDDDTGITLIAQSKPVPMRPSAASCIWTAVA